MTGTACAPKPSTCIKVPNWSCNDTYDKCKLVSHEGYLYGTLEPVTEASNAEPQEDPRYTKALTLASAIKFIADCGEEQVVDTDTFNLLTTNPDGTIKVQKVNKDGETIGTPYVIGTPHTVDTDTHGSISVASDGTVTWTAPDGSTQTWVGSEHPPATVDTNTFGTFVDNGNNTYTWTPAGGGTPFTLSTSTVTDTDTYGTFVDNGNDTYTWTPAGGGTPFTLSTASPAGPAPTTKALGYGTWYADHKDFVVTHVRTSPMNLQPVSGATSNPPIEIAASTGVVTAKRDFSGVLTLHKEWIRAGTAFHTNIKAVESIFFIDKTQPYDIPVEVVMMSRNRNIDTVGRRYATDVVHTNPQNSNTVTVFLDMKAGDTFKLTTGIQVNRWAPSPVVSQLMRLILGVQIYEVLTETHTHG